MKKIISTIMVAMLSLAPTVILAAESETIQRGRIAGTDLSFIRVIWQADGSGDKADVTVTGVNKYLWIVQTDPGSTAPADNYELTLTDATGINVMGLESGANPLADLDTTTTEEWMPKPAGKGYGAHFVYGDMTIAFTDQANADCDGVIWLWLIDP